MLHLLNPVELLCCRHVCCSGDRPYLNEYCANLTTYNSMYCTILQLGLSITLYNLMAQYYWPSRGTLSPYLDSWQRVFLSQLTTIVLLSCTLRLTILRVCYLATSVCYFFMCSNIFVSLPGMLHNYEFRGKGRTEILIGS